MLHFRTILKTTFKLVLVVCMLIQTAWCLSTVISCRTRGNII